MAHIIWYGENMEEKQLSFIQRHKNMQFDADADIYMNKKYEILIVMYINEIFITV